MDLGMVVVFYGMHLASLPPECVSRCYYQKDCSSLFYDVSTNLCQLSTEVYLESDLTNTSRNMQFLAWRRDDCGTGYTWDRTLGLCYKIYTSRKTWFQVNTTCHQDGGYPIKVDSADINALMNKISDSHYDTIWLGGFLHGIWTWPDGSIINPVFLDDNQPEDGAEKRMLIERPDKNFIRRWHDYPCTHATKFVCQLPLKGKAFC